MLPSIEEEIKYRFAPGFQCVKASLEGGTSVICSCLKISNCIQFEVDPKAFVLVIEDTAPGATTQTISLLRVPRTLSVSSHCQKSMDSAQKNGQEQPWKPCPVTLLFVWPVAVTHEAGV